MKKRVLAAIRTVLPSYAIVPVLLTVAVYFFAFYVPKLLTFGRTPLDVTMKMDGWIPLWTPSVVIYVLAFPQWAAGLLLAARQEKALCHRLLSGLLYTLVLSFLFFVAVPTAAVRPEITGKGFFDRALSLIYSVDPPTTLCPSFHCIASWSVARTLFASPRVPRWAAVLNLLFSVAVFASTVLTKQHLFLDIPTALLFAELGLALSRRVPLTPLFDRAERALFA